MARKPTEYFRITDRMIVTALHCLGSRWGWMAMPKSLRADLREAFKIIAAANKSMALRRLHARSE